MNNLETSPLQSAHLVLQPYQTVVLELEKN